MMKIFKLFVALTLICIALSPMAEAVNPPPDGGYPGGNTAEGDRALLSLTTGHNNTAIGDAALQDNTTGYNNTATGLQALNNNTVGHSNTASGVLALDHNTTGDSNTANGAFTLNRNTTGDGSTAVGASALFENTTGGKNTAVGNQALNQNTTGNFNIALGLRAGSNLTTGNSNIDIGNDGLAGEYRTIRIGTQGTHTKTFIAGIHGAMVNGNAVFVDNNGKLGTVPSSQRFKDGIKPMDKASEAILALKPVTFHYKKEIDPEAKSQFGLIAEEVAKVNPALVLQDEEGKPYTVRYEAVNAMLLNEFLKEHRHVQEQDGMIAQQQKQIEALTVGLQKVNAQLELNKSNPQMAENTQ
jgi:hypothetical protein